MEEALSLFVTIPLLVLLAMMLFFPFAVWRIRREVIGLREDIKKMSLLLVRIESSTHESASASKQLANEARAALRAD